MIDFFHLGSNDTATQKPPPHHRREQLLAGWERVSKTARQRQCRHQASTQDHPPHAYELLARRVDREDDGTTGMKRWGRTTKRRGRETKRRERETKRWGGKQSDRGGERNDGGKGNGTKKGPRNVVDVPWATGNFFFLTQFIFILLTMFFRYYF